MVNDALMSLIDDCFGLSVMDKPFFGNPGRQLPINYMRTDVIENDDNYELTMDLPGIKKEEVKIELENDTLTITAETSSSTDETKDNYVRRERFAGKQMRRMAVPSGLKKEDISASLDNGILKVIIPKPAKPDPETIEVK